MSEKINIIFLGTPTIACPFLEKLAKDSRFEVFGVITQEDKPVGRKKVLTPSPVKQLALDLKLPLFQPPKLNKDEALISELTALQPDFLVVVAYGQILSSKVLNIPKIKPINVHGSILPMYRGASPIEQAILNGDTETGLSIMEMVKAMDAGPVYQILKHPISPTDNDLTLREKLSAFGAEQLPDILFKIKYEQLSSTPQQEKLATYCQKISKEDGQINPLEQTAEQIYNRWRAFTPWPGISVKIQDKNLKLLEIEKVHQNIPSGKFAIEGKQILLGTAEGTISLKKLQLEGRNAQDASVFITGNRHLLNSST